MNRLGRWTFLAMRLPFAIAVVWFNVSLWTLDPDVYDATSLPEDVPPSLDALVDELQDGAGEEMQQLFPEGYVITHALVGFAWVDVALRAEPGSALHVHALEQARWVESRIDTTSARSIFPASVTLPHGAFYRGYRAWLRGGILLADPDATAAEKAAFRRDCAEIAAAFETDRTPFLETYRELPWPGDSVFLAASLALHDRLFAPQYTERLSWWVREVKASVDPETGLVPHFAGTSELVVSRGISSVLMSRMLYEVDPEFARSHYTRTRDLFIDAHLGILPGVREYRPGQEGSGDVDTGPLVFGFSGSGSIIGIAAARVHGDRAYADPALVGAHAVGIPIGDRYGFGLLPVGEAFFAWAKTTTPWVGPAPEPREFSGLMLPGWRFAWHVLGSMALLLIFAPELWRWRKRRSATLE